MNRLNATKSMRDIHFVPQSNYCGNLTKYIEDYDSKLNLDTVTREEMFALFSRKGVNISNAPKVFALLEKGFPPTNTTAAGTAAAQPDTHITHASHHVKYLYEHAQYRDLLLSYYWEDMRNFNLTPPSRNFA